MKCIRLSRLTIAAASFAFMSNGAWAETLDASEAEPFQERSSPSGRTSPITATPMPAAPETSRDSGRPTADERAGLSANTGGSRDSREQDSAADSHLRFGTWTPLTTPNY